MKKKLIGIYLPVYLINKLKKFVVEIYLKENIGKSQSEIIEESLKKYLDEQEKNNKST